MSDHNRIRKFAEIANLLEEVIDFRECKIKIKLNREDFEDLKKTVKIDTDSREIITVFSNVTYHFFLGN
jgi:hypothetical protein